VFNQAPVALGEEGVGAAGGGDDLAEGAGQPGVAFAGGSLFGLAGGRKCRPPWSEPVVTQLIDRGWFERFSLSHRYR
jgi:hypothetical protein